MTREEAIEILIREIDEDPFMRTEYREQIHEALKMAIKALEQEPCDDDAISRQAVLNKILKFSVTDGKSVSVTGLWTEVNDLPLITPQSKSGHWKMRHYIDKNRQGFNMWWCSECYKEYSYDAETGEGITDACYCPNCGAKMKSEDKE